MLISAQAFQSPVARPRISRAEEQDIGVPAAGALRVRAADDQGRRAFIASFLHPVAFTSLLTYKKRLAIAILDENLERIFSINTRQVR